MEKIMRYSFLSVIKIKFPHIAIAVLFLGQVCSLNAAPMYYTFNGIIEGFSSATGLVSPEDFGVVLNKKVSYTFEVDFERDVSTNTNSAGTWEYFYTELVLGDVLIQGERPHKNYGYNAFLNSGPRRPSAINGSGGVRIKTLNPHVQNWSIGMQLSLQDSGYFFTDDIGAVYVFGSVELTSISSTFSHGVPEPSILLLFSSTLGLLGLARFRKKQGEINGL